MNVFNLCDDTYGIMVTQNVLDIYTYIYNTSVTFLIGTYYSEQFGL